MLNNLPSTRFYTSELHGQLTKLRNNMEIFKYVIIPKAIHGLGNYSNYLKQLKRTMKSKGAIFQQMGEKIKNDHKRHELILPYETQIENEPSQDDYIKSLSNCAKEIMNKLFFTRDKINRKIKYYLNQSPVTILYSEKNCMEQDMHYDYNPTGNYSDKCYACIIFLEDNSSLMLQIGDNTIEQQFNQGDIIIFRADKAHAGAKRGSKDNIRLHYYFNHPSFKPEKDKTYLKNGFSEVVQSFNSIAQRVARHKVIVAKANTKRMKGIKQIQKNRKIRKSHEENFKNTRV